MKSDFQEFLEDNADDCDYSVRSYSGRSMYGRKCIAIVCDHEAITTLAHLAWVAGEANDYGFQERIDQVLVDNMGKGAIMYWPNEPFVADVKLCANCSEPLCKACGECHADDCKVALPHCEEEN